MGHKDKVNMSVKEIERLKVVTDVTEKRISLLIDISSMADGLD